MYEDDFLEAAYEDRFHFDEPLGFEAGYDGYSDDEDEECLHQWEGGMCVVHPEDLAEVVKVREVVCGKCEAKPIEGVDY